MGIDVVFDFPPDLLKIGERYVSFRYNRINNHTGYCDPAFGVGRIGKIASEIGLGVRNFREGLNGDKEEKPE